MVYSLKSLFLFSVCLAYSSSSEQVEQDTKCKYKQNELLKNRQSHEKGNGFYYECESNGFFVEKQCADGLRFDKDSLVKWILFNSYDQRTLNLYFF